MAFAQRRHYTSSELISVKTVSIQSSAHQLSATPLISPVKTMYYQGHHKNFTRLRTTPNPGEFTYTRCKRGPPPLCNTAKLPELGTFLQLKGGKNLLLLWTYKKKSQQAFFSYFIFHNYISYFPGKYC